MHVIIQQRHISEDIPHIYKRSKDMLNNVCVFFPEWSTKKTKKQRRHPHVVRDLQAHVALSGCELMSSCLPPTLDASEGSGIADQIRQVVKYT